MSINDARSYLVIKSRNLIDSFKKMGEAKGVTEVLACRQRCEAAITQLEKAVVAAEHDQCQMIAALDAAGVALGNAACSLAEFENFEFNMEKARARAEQASKNAFDAINASRGDAR